MKRRKLSREVNRRGGRTLNKIINLLFITLLLFSMMPGTSLSSSAATSEPRQIDREATATGKGGAAASLDPRATEVALEILREGGNAIDASVAAAAMLGVVRPYDGSIGGDGYMTIYLADENKSYTIDHEAMAPANLDEPLFRSLSSREARALSVAVPSLVRGWELALDEFGTMGFSEVLEPAIAEAENGFLVDDAYRDRTASNRNKFLNFTSSREYYLTEDLAVPEVGDIVYNTDLAKTYRIIANQGADAFYNGEIAQAIVEAVNNPPLSPDQRINVLPSSMEMEDLSQYTAVLREPTKHNYRGYEIVGAGGTTTGGPTIAEILNIMEGFEFESREQMLHAFIESSRLSFADRATYIGTSPNWEGAVKISDAPYNGIMSQQFAEHRRQLIGSNAIPGDVPFGDPFAYDPDAMGHADLSDYPGEGPQDTSTTHLTVSDQYGNVVSYTFTITSIGGSGIAVPGYGFLLNNDNIGSIPPPESDERGGRMYSNMAPTIMFKDGQPVMALGGPGSAQIIAAVSQILANYIDLDMSLKEALATPRLSNTGPGLTSLVERSFLDKESELIETLVSRGHQFSETNAISNANGIQFFQDGHVQAVAEPERYGGAAAGVVNPVTAVSMKTEVERLKEEGAFESEAAARALGVHLVAVSHYEEQGNAGKVTRHMEGFKVLLNHQFDNELISKKTYDFLMADTDALIKHWE